MIGRRGVGDGPAGWAEDCIVPGPLHTTADGAPGPRQAFARVPTGERSVAPLDRQPAAQPDPQWLVRHGSRVPGPLVEDLVYEHAADAQLDERQPEVPIDVRGEGAVARGPLERAAPYQRDVGDEV